MKNNLIFASILTFIFFLVMFLTLSNYGPSWDETLHFSRGQAYLHFFLTGSKDYSNLWVPRRSFYQFDYHSGDFWFKDNGGHPPVSDILATFSNYIFYQKLGVLSDIHSYHLFNIFVSSILVFVVVYFSLYTFGKFAASVSFLSLVSYPLFFAESHFNVKDPAEVAFFASTLLSFFLSIQIKNSKLLFLSFVFFGLGLGTKFNILFLPFIIVAYLLLKKSINIPKSFWFPSILGIIFVAALFILAWPFLWNDFPNNLVKVFAFYKAIGTGAVYQPPEFFILGFNIFPISWILFTTPPIVLVLSLIGMVTSILNRKLYGGVTMLWFFWLVVPIARVTFPGTSIYGGVRQIMEFLPALALLSGLGAWQILEWTKKFNKQTLVIMILMLIFIWPTYVLFKMHPNQNVYFNFLIGGLKGAAEKNFPSFGNSYGNAHFQGINWLNQHAEQNAKVSLIQGIEVNSPDILYRPDIQLNNGNWSGIGREGEYLMELTFNDTGKAFYYTWEYVDKFLEPVYELKVDDVAILKIWKNDLDHTKVAMRLKEAPYSGIFSLSTLNNNLEIVFPQTITLSKVELKFQQTDNCSHINTSFVETSINNISWVREKDWIPFPQVRKTNNLRENEISFHFAGREAKAIKFVFDNKNSCGLNHPEVSVVNLI